MTRHIQESDAEIQFIRQTDTEIEFMLMNVSTNFANALRRVIIAEVPTIAIDVVQFAQNSSPIPDEMIAHRLGLIPLMSANAQFLTYPNECQKCQGSGCPLCRVSFYCDVTSKDESQDVTSKDLVWFDYAQTNSFPGEEYIHANFMSRMVRPVEIPAVIGMEPVPILITKIGPRQQLKFMAHAVKGTGRVHAKWAPVSACAYRHVPEIHIDQEQMKNIHSREEKERIVHTCPTGVFRYDPTKETVEIEDASRCTFCNQCMEHINEFHPTLDLIDISNKPDCFHFLVESTGCMNPSLIVSKAFEVLKAKLTTFLNELKSASTY